MTKDANKLTALQGALIGAGMDSFRCHNNGVDYPLAIKDLPDATILRLIGYGKRMFNDIVNSTAARTDKAKGTICKELIERFLAGNVGTGGGRSRISTLERALRDTVKPYLLSVGITPKDATALCKKPESAFRSYLLKKGVSKDKLEAAYNKHWPTIMAKAKALIELEEFDLETTEVKV